MATSLHDARIIVHERLRDVLLELILTSEADADDREAASDLADLIIEGLRLEVTAVGEDVVTLTIQR